MLLFIPCFPTLPSLLLGFERHPYAVHTHLPSTTLGIENAQRIENKVSKYTKWVEWLITASDL
jgi:hypothetical protein